MLSLLLPPSVSIIRLASPAFSILRLPPCTWSLSSTDVVPIPTLPLVSCIVTREVAPEGWVSVAPLFEVTRCNLLLAPS